MKVQHTTVFVGDVTQNRRMESTDLNKTKKGNSVFAGDLNQKLDPIAQKKKRAQQQAMQIVGDAFEGDRKIDRDMEARREKIRVLQEEIQKAQSEVNDMEAKRKALKEVYGIQDGSTEQKELDLLEKASDAALSFKEIRLTREEREEVERIKADGLTEYQKRSLEMKEYSDYYEKQIHEMQTQIKEEDMMLRSAKLERLKSSPMVKAEKQADAVMEAAGEEIIGMLIEEAKEKIDEDLEEKKEAAEKVQEEKEQQEAVQEKAKEKRKEQEELTEVITESVQQMQGNDNQMDELQEEVDKVLDKLKLLQEDLKGAAIDEIL